MNSLRPAASGECNRPHGLRVSSAPFIARVVFLCVIIVVAMQTAFCNAAALKVREVPVGKVQPGIVQASVVVSPDFRRVAFVAIQGGKHRVFVEGKLVATLDGVGFGTPAMSLDGQRLLFVGIRGTNSFVTVDGVEGKTYESIDRAQFSPDGKHFVFVVQRGDRFSVVLDDVEGPSFEQIGEGDPQFSEDGNHVAYAAKRDGKWLLMHDGKPGPSFEAVGRGAFYFSADGKTIAYLAVRRGKYVVIKDGVEGKEYASITDLTINPTGRVAYRAVSGTEQRVVVNEKEGPACEEIVQGSLAFSKTGARFGYGEKKNGGFHLVVDGMAGSAMQAVGPPVFSPQGTRVAYKAARDLDELVVLDGKEGASFFGISTDGPVFSADGSRLAYVARRGISWVVVVDGVAGDPYDGIGMRSMKFSPDGRHLAYWAKRDIRSVLVVDGHESPEYRAYIGKHSPRWDNAGNVSGLVLKGDEFVRIEAESPGN